MQDVIAGTVEDKFLTINGLRFHYRDWKNENSPPLVVLHGFSQHSRVWDTFAKTMQASYRVLALDQRGHGETEWSTDYSDMSLVNDIDDFRRKLGLRRIALLGHSLGGFFAYVYTALHPDAVDRLVIVENGPPNPRDFSGGPPPPEIPSSFENLDEALAFARQLSPLAQEAELYNQWVPNLVQRDSQRLTWRYDRQGWTNFTQANSGEGKTALIDSSKLWDLLSKISCPTLLVFGDQSPVVAKLDVTRMTRTIRNCRSVIVSRSGHNPQRDNPKEFNKTVKAFLEQ